MNQINLQQSTNQATKKSISLAPKVLKNENEIKKIRPYLNSLKIAIDDKDITNIALTGAYGAGKSTILETFKYKNNQDYKFLNISLASFTDISENETKTTKEEFERKLEVSILQQIFYHVEPSEIPDSRFKRITYFSKNELLKLAFGFILWLISAIIILKLGYISKLNPENWNYEFYYLDVWALVFLAIFFWGIGVFSNTIITLFKNSKINKVNLQGEIELGDKLDKSIFNEHLEEIIYFFEKTDYNVVIIEDLDRFETTEIFTKLREINILLNNAKTIHRKIKFIYAINDGIFKDKTERVKFFEYIVPVIPFINPANAKDKLINLIQEAELNGALSNDFTSDVVSFINDIDMRLLTNIVHEYSIYKSNLSSSLIQENLFALITYKNLFPDDFILLHKKEGELYSFVSKKDIYLKTFLNKINDEIEIKTKEISNIEEENFKKIEELRAVYINEIISDLPPNSVLSNLKARDLVKDDEFDNLINKQTLTHIQFTHYYNHQYNLSNSEQYKFNFSKIENKISSDFKYVEREKFIKDKSNDKTEILKKEIDKLKSEKRSIENWDLKQIFSKVSIDKFINEKFKDNDLVRMLILEGYINENYEDYISIFHEGNLTNEDFNFLKGIKANKTFPYQYKLENKANLIKEIKQHQFSRDSILNFDLLDYLGHNYENYKIQYDDIIKFISNDKQSSIDFIDQYLFDQNRVHRVFINKLTESWKEFWDFIYLKSNYPKDKQDQYLKYIIQYSDVDSLISDQNKRTLSTAIMQKNYFLKLIQHIDIQKVEALLKQLDIKFESLDSPDNELVGLFEYIYDNNLYQINIENIKNFIKHFDNKIKLDNLYNLNYQTITESNCDKLKDYVEVNFENYITNVLLKLSNTNQESEEFTVKILNHDIDEKVLNKFIELSRFDDIKNLSLVDNFNMKQGLLKAGRVFPSWENVIDYFEELDEFEIDEVLLNYFNNDMNSQELSNNKIEDVFDSESKDYLEGFYLKLINKPELSDNSFKYLTESAPQGLYDTFEINHELFNPNKVNALISSGIINISKTNYFRVREHFAPLHIKMIEKYQKDFFDNIDDYELSQRDKLTLIASSKINEKNKELLIEKLKDPILTQSNELDNLVCHVYAESSFVPDLDFEEMKKLVKNSKSIKDVAILIFRKANNLDNTQLQFLVESINDNYKKIFEKFKQPTFKKIEYNHNLFEELRNRGMIIRFEVNKNNSTEYRVFANHK
ncbi:hypothetical protein [Chryseobacterium gambrini]|uniref:Membrane protein n=1 Tax=Chryseobacterium gambrini TaxID=373672 RepID=A0ABN7CG17_9FLAO|nr:membrane protein [Chryseobacterium gambrini]